MDTKFCARPLNIPISSIPSKLSQIAGNFTDNNYRKKNKKTICWYMYGWMSRYL